jgi:hypothetical protein
MIRRSSVWLIGVALLVGAMAPAAFAQTDDSPITNGTLTFLNRDLTGQNLGVFRGVYVEFGFNGFEANEIDRSAGAVVVRLYDSRGRIVAAVSSREGVFDNPGTQLSVPIDSVWGTFDYDADGYWTQARNQRINGGNCEDISLAEVLIWKGGSLLSGRIEGPPVGSCQDIRP